jgi:hypothetical protein
MEKGGSPANIEAHVKVERYQISRQEEKQKFTPSLPKEMLTQISRKVLNLIHTFKYFQTFASQREN